MRQVRRFDNDPSREDNYWDYGERLQFWAAMTVYWKRVGVEPEESLRKAVDMYLKGFIRQMDPCDRRALDSQVELFWKKWVVPYVGSDQILNTGFETYEMGSNKLRWAMTRMAQCKP